MQKQGKQSPLKGIDKSDGVELPQRILLAEAVKKAGGPERFKNKFGLDAYLKANKAQFGEYATNKKEKKSIRNLWHTWTAISSFEDWIDKVYVPIQKLKRCHEKAASNNFTSYRDTTCSSDSETESESEEDYIPVSNKRILKPESTPTRSKRAKHNPKIMNANQANQKPNKIGDRLVVSLPLGRTLVIYWVDSNLSNLKVEISNDGLSVIAKTKLRHPKTATELLDHYDWGGEFTNMAVSALDTLLKSDESGLKPEPGAPEWSDPEVIVALDEPVLRSFVDIKGNETGHIGYRSDGGRQAITFILQNETYRAAPAAGVFTNDSAAMDSEFEEETVTDTKMSELEAKLAQQAEAMKKQSEQQAEAMKKQSETVDQMAKMMMMFMQTSMNQQNNNPAAAAKANNVKPQPAAAPPQVLPKQVPPAAAPPQVQSAAAQAPPKQVPPAAVPVAQVLPPAAATQKVQPAAAQAPPKQVPPAAAPVAQVLPPAAAPPQAQPANAAVPVQPAASNPTRVPLQSITRQPTATPPQVIVQNPSVKKPATADQEKRKTQFKNPLVKPSRESRDGEQGKRQKKGREAFMKKLRMQGSPPAPPAGLPKEIPTMVDPEPASPISLSGKSSSTAEGLMDELVKELKSEMKTNSELQKDMNDTISEGQAILNGLHLKKKWKLEVCNNEEEWNNA